MSFIIFGITLRFCLNERLGNNSAKLLKCFSQKTNLKYDLYYQLKKSQVSIPKVNKTIFVLYRVADYLQLLTTIVHKWRHEILDMAMTMLYLTILQQLTYMFVRWPLKPIFVLTKSTRNQTQPTRSIFWPSTKEKKSDGLIKLANIGLSLQPNHHPKVRLFKSMRFTL